jgi:hypothetical protein
VSAVVLLLALLNVCFGTRAWLVTRFPVRQSRIAEMGGVRQKAEIKRKMGQCKEDKQMGQKRTNATQKTIVPALFVSHYPERALLNESPRLAWGSLGHYAHFCTLALSVL